ncbi:MAG TPA: M48 family metalloprotease [Gemmatales bacterium]|nr:M48 family metalloprotease [Gemmatales bacterium]
MRLIFFLILAIVFFAPLGETGPVDVTRAVVLTSFVLLLMGLTAELPSTYLVHCIYQRPDRRYEWAKLLRHLRRLHLGVAIGMYFTTLLFCGWPTVVRRHWHLAQTLFLDEVFILLPFVLGLIFSWSSFYRVERALHQTGDGATLEPMPTLGEFLKSIARFHLGLLLEPLLVFAAIQGAMQGYDAGWPWWGVLLFGVASLLAIAWFLPWVWIRAWDTHPIPHGPRRDLLLNLCDRLGYRLTNLLVWNTSNQQAMAMILGYLPRPRFVIFSDLLLDQLSDDEVCTILAHELGHLRYRHLWVLLVYTLLSLLFWTLACWMLTQAVRSASFTDQILLQLALFSSMILYVRLTLCEVSRLLEREADLMACTIWHDRSPSFGLSVYAGALHHVAQLNGESPDHVDWMHGSVTNRLEFLQNVIDDPLAQEQFLRRMLWLKTGLVAALLSLSLWVWYMWQR